MSRSTDPDIDHLRRCASIRQPRPLPQIVGDRVLTDQRQPLRRNTTNRHELPEPHPMSPHPPVPRPDINREQRNTETPNRLGSDTGGQLQTAVLPRDHRVSRRIHRLPVRLNGIQPVAEDRRHTVGRSSRETTPHPALRYPPAVPPATRDTQTTPGLSHRESPLPRLFRLGERNHDLAGVV